MPGAITKRPTWSKLWVCVCVCVCPRDEFQVNPTVIPLETGGEHKS